MVKDTADFYLNKLEPIMGGEVVGGFKDKDGEFFGLRIENNNRKYNLWLLSDDEGNGPGSFELTREKRK